jgi:hypothetical protein
MTSMAVAGVTRDTNCWCLSSVRQTGTHPTSIGATNLLIINTYDVSVASRHIRLCPAGVVLFGRTRTHADMANGDNWMSRETLQAAGSAISTSRSTANTTSSTVAVRDNV